jgi:hypothetical protein
VDNANALPVLVSIPAIRFQKSSREMLGFIKVVIQNSTWLEYTVRMLANAVIALPEKTPTELPQGIRDSAAEFATGKQGGPLEELMKYLPLQSELLFSRSIDNVLTYISELLALIFSTRPEMLRSDEKISTEWALQYANREDLLAALTERKVHRLSFNGFMDLHDDLNGKFGFRLFQSPKSLGHAASLVEKRNLIAHNRGIVNRRYLERVPSAPEKLGDRLQFDPNEVFDDLTFLTASVIDIDTRAGEKFGIPRNEPVQGGSGFDPREITRLIDSLGK